MKTGIATIRLFMFGCLLMGYMAAAQAQDSSAQQSAPDNTKMNQGDSSPSQSTADQQKDNRSDRDITQQIRKSIMADKSLSTYAHNVKVISQSGMVTLKGPLRSDDEKRPISPLWSLIYRNSVLLNLQCANGAPDCRTNS